MAFSVFTALELEPTTCQIKHFFKKTNENTGILIDDFKEGFVFPLKNETTCTFR